MRFLVNKVRKRANLMTIPQRMEHCDGRYKQVSLILTGKFTHIEYSYDFFSLNLELIYMHSCEFQFSSFAILILFEKHTRANKFLLYSKLNDYLYKFNISSFSSVKSQENLLRYSLNTKILPKQKTS